MKKLILCCDGTWNNADQTTDGQLCPTNVVKLALRVARSDAAGVPQIVYYHEGVGTGNWIDHLTGGAFGDGLEDNVYAIYRFLVGNYAPGDQIFLFGFSRGAYTARSVAGMIRKCGILRRDLVRKYPDAVSLYRSAVHPDDDPACRFRSDCGINRDRPTPIRCIGVWDTVGALGIPMAGLRRLTHAKYQFFDTELSGSVQYAFHALAIDEHRQPFVPTLWDAKAKPGQVVEQRWFCGAHSDVGGGYLDCALSDIALRWMLERVGGADADGPGLALDAEVMAAMPLAPDPVHGRLHDSRTGIFKLGHGVDRVIGYSRAVAGRDAQWDPAQALHPSVYARWDADAAYRPAGLRAYFERVGDPRASA